MSAAFFCLAWTVICEAGVYRFVLRRREKILDLCLVNLFTNPLLNVSLARISPELFSYAVIVLEVLVVLVEWQIFRGLKLERPLYASLVLNASSLFLGMAAMALL
jgi:hypothetical protein